MKIDYTQYYRKWHSDTAEHRAYTSALYQRLLREHLPADRSAKILDVGCGMGFVLMALRELDYTTLTGLDCDEGQVAACQAKGLPVVLCDDTVAFLVSHPKEYDVLLVLDVLEHVPVSSQMAFVVALHAALKDDGVLICTVPNANSLVAERWRYNDWTHHSSFTEHSLDLLLFSSGFKTITIQPYELFDPPATRWLPIKGGRHWWAFRFFRWWRRMQCRAELGAPGREVPLSLNLMALAKKQ